jgi:hypothetical protein
MDFSDIGIALIIISVVLVVAGILTLGVYVVYTLRKDNKALQNYIDSQPTSRYKVTQKVENGFETLEYGVYKDGSKKLLRSSFTGTVGERKDVEDYYAEDYL